MADRDAPESERFEPRRIAADVIALLEGELATRGFSLLDVRVFRGGGRITLRIFVDTPAGGISLDEVATASRTCSMILEEADRFQDAWVLEVSSPGVRRPLRLREHWLAAVGQRVEVRVVVGDATKRLRGTLVEVGETSVTIRPQPRADAEAGASEPQPVTLGMGRLREANLDPDFDVQALIHADRRQKKDAKQQARRERQPRRKGRPKAGKDPQES